jgi:3-isopropylmalate/(R)-2-methylmalate dehydratase large subunit
MEDAIRFRGRVLFLSADPAVVERQLSGEDVGLEVARPLRDHISTDEITPAWACFYYDETLGRYPYVGLKCEDRFPVTEDSVVKGGFSVSVSGKRRGKGSSREASPYAEMCAGIRLIIAESFERIYQQNCHNLGLFISTDFGMVDRVRAGDEIRMEEFTCSWDPLTQEIIRSGGLFGFNKRRAENRVHIALPMHPAGPMTYAEKVIARSVVRDIKSDERGVPRVKPGDGVFVRADWRFSYDLMTPLSVAFLEQALGQDYRVKDPATVLCFRDHLVFVHYALDEKKRSMGLLDAALELNAVQKRFCARNGIRLHGELVDREGSEGICHSLMAERYACPGQVIVGTDSHTPHSGALGALAFGVGSTDIANAWITGDVRIKVPATCRVQLHGRLPEGVAAKDLILHLLTLPYFRENRALGQVIEYAGDTLTHLNTDERATLTNMVAEIGGFTGVVPPDEETRRFVLERRGIEVMIEPWMRSDPDADFAHTIEIDCSQLEPMLARPGDPGNGIGLSALDGGVAVDIAYGGSCTGGKREDMERYHEVLVWGLSHGLKVNDRVKFYLQFGSRDVRDYCVRNGIFATFETAGVTVIEPGCGACIGAGPGVSTSAGQVTVSAINRNFPARSGPGQVWLASPATVAASALAGCITSFKQLREHYR